jgi:hypothetical protein
VTASLIMRQLASYPRQNGVAAAIREISVRPDRLRQRQVPPIGDWSETWSCRESPCKRCRQQPEQCSIECGDLRQVHGDFGFACHRPRAAPVGSMMMDSQPASITSIGSRARCASP